MLNIDILYLILNIILLAAFYYTGRIISQGKTYWDKAMICIIAFSLILGLRYARGNDYFHYVHIYVHGYKEGRQLVFTWINDLLKWMGVGKYYIFLFYSFIEIVCAMIFLKRYRMYAQYMLPLFLIANITFDEGQIRQALGFSFVFLCLDRLFGIKKIKQNIFAVNNHKNIALAVLYFSIAYSIHSVCGYMLIIMIGLFLLCRRTIPIWLSIPALLICTYFFSIWFDFSWLNPILNQFVGEDNRMSHYLENSEVWFSAEGMEIKYERNPLILFAEMLGTISLYILGAKVINKYAKRADAYAMYNFFVIGSIIQNAFRQLELLNRIGGDFMLFWFFPLSLVLYYRKEIINIRFFNGSIYISYIKPLLNNNIYKVLAAFLLWYAYEYLKYLFMRGDMTRFIWDI